MSKLTQGVPDWKEELTAMIGKGCSDSAIEDFIEAHPAVDRKDVWDFVYEYDAPRGCKGCKHIQMTGTMPCIQCVRQVETRDYYESRV